ERMRKSRWRKQTQYAGKEGEPGHGGRNRISRLHALRVLACQAQRRLVAQGEDGRALGGGLQVRPGARNRLISHPVCGRGVEPGLEFGLRRLGRRLCVQALMPAGGSLREGLGSWVAPGGHGGGSRSLFSATGESSERLTRASARDMCFSIARTEIP